MSAIIVDKNFSAVSAITDRNIVLVKGRVVLEGSAADLKRDAQACSDTSEFRPSFRAGLTSRHLILRH